MEQPLSPARSQDAFLTQLGDEIRDAYQRNRRVMSFGEFFELAKRQPVRYSRSAAQYIKDVFDHYGTTEVQTPRGPQTRYLLFDCPFAEGKDRLIGQEEVQGRVYRALSNFVRDGRISKLIMLHGPNGSAKSTFVACLMRAMEHYSTLEEGALYRFNWIFPSQKLTRGGIGFGGAPGSGEGAGVGIGDDTFAHLDDEQIDVKLPDETHDHPLLLLPLLRRRQLLDELRSTVGPSLTFSEYLYHGDLSPRNKDIFEALLQSYKGDFLKALRHVQVERFYISRRYRRGVVTIEPQMSVDAGAQQITADRSLSALPPALQALSMVSFGGELVDGSRGLIEYADLLKRPLEAYKYLLGTVEHGRVPVAGHMLYLDAVFIASSNELHLQAFKELPDFQSFKGRMELVRVPYLLDFTKERGIYDEQIRESAVGKHVAPHATWVAAIWGVLTRMRKPLIERYEKTLGELVGRLTPLDKAYLYALRRVPAGLSPEQAKDLLSGLDQIWGESDSYPIFEGRTGISPRELKTLLLNAAQNAHYKCLSPFAVLDEVEELLKTVSVHEFLKQEPLPGGYHEHRRFVQQVRDELLAIIDEEVRSAMGLIDEAQYVEVFVRYVNHVSHWVKKERLMNPITGELEEPDGKMMAEIERAVGISGKADEHRRDLMRRIAAWSIDHAGEIGQKRGLQHLDFGKIFPEQFQSLRESYFAEHKKQLKKINEDLLIYLNEGGASAPLDRDSAERVRTTLRNLTERYHYNEDSARDAISFLLRKRYS